MAKPEWKDPIVEEVRAVRKTFDKELRNNPKRFMARARKRAIALGFRLVLPPGDSNQKFSKAGKKNVGNSK